MTTPTLVAASSTALDVARRRVPSCRSPDLCRSRRTTGADATTPSGEEKSTTTSTVDASTSSHDAAYVAPKSSLGSRASTRAPIVNSPDALQRGGHDLSHAPGAAVDRECFHDRTLSARRRRSSMTRYAPTPMISTTPTIDAVRPRLRCRARDSGSGSSTPPSARTTCWMRPLRVTFSATLLPVVTLRASARHPGRYAMERTNVTADVRVARPPTCRRRPRSSRASTCRVDGSVNHMLGRTVTALKTEKVPTVLARCHCGLSSASCIGESTS